MNKALLAAVLYLRMSSDEQTLSIEQQRNELTKWANEQGYTIIGEYIDEGKSGSKDTEKRTEFQRMLLDSNSGKFKAILVYESSRFGRLDSIEGAFAKSILRQNGIFLHAKLEGKIDWNTFDGRVKDLFLSEKNHEYSVSLSANTIRGRQHLHSLGYWVHGSIPYGFDRLYIDGDKTMIIPRSQYFRKPRNWRLKLTINEQEAKNLKWIFNELDQKSISMRSLATLVASSGIPTPNGEDSKHWTQGTIRGLIKNPVYKGLAQIGHARKSKKNQFHASVPTEQNNIPIIIDPQQWDRVNEKMQKRKKYNAFKPSKRSSPLSGILYCGHCGYRLAKHAKKTGGNSYSYFMCDSPFKRPKLGCKQWRIAEQEILPIVSQKLVELIDFEMLKNLQAKPQAETINDITIMEEQAEKLKDKIEDSMERLATIDKKLFAGYQKKVLKWQEEMEQLEDKIRLIQNVRNETGLMRFGKKWSEIKNDLVIISNFNKPIGVDPDDFPSEDLITISDYSKSESKPIVLNRGAMAALKDVSQDGLSEWLFGCLVDSGAVVLTESAVFRNFLEQVKCKVVLKWKPRPIRSAKGLRKGLPPRFFEVDWTETTVSVDFDGRDIVSGDSSMTHQEEPYDFRIKGRLVFAN